MTHTVPMPHAEKEGQAGGRPGPPACLIESIVKEHPSAHLSFSQWKLLWFRRDDKGRVTPLNVRDSPLH